MRVRSETRADTGRQRVFRTSVPARILRPFRLALLLGAMIGATACREAAPPPPMVQSAYVWQRSWTEEVVDAVAGAGDAVDTFMVLAGELTVERGRVSVTRVSVNWDAFASGAARVVPVIRAHAQLDTLLDAATSPDTAAQISAFYDAVAATAAKSGVHLTALQLDYDCPTSKLPRYARLLEYIRRERPELKLSITALPTWLGDASFAGVVRNTEAWVLQVHSFERPARDDDSLTVCRVDQISGYVTRAAKFGVPFQLALPTYGYDVAFDETGAFAALAAEGGARQWPDTYTVRRVRTDPAAMAQLVAKFTNDRPQSMVGIVWFRLPVATDEMNWSSDTLAQVMIGEAPTAHVEAELRYPEPGLAEVWVSGTMAGTRASIALPRQYANALAHDTFAGFARTVKRDGDIQLAGEIGTDAKEMLVAWFRMPAGSSEMAQKLEVQCAR